MVELTPRDQRRIEALYDGGILYADGYLGRLIDLLRELGHWEETLLVVLSDHGEEFWDHGNVGHAHTLFQELVHVPLLVRLPGDRHSGRRVEATVRLIDVGPTILDLVGGAPISESSSAWASTSAT